MTREEARQLIFDALGGIAPEVDGATVDDGLDLTEQLDLDSMDYLSWMIAISEESGVEIPQRETARFMTIDGAIAYLTANA